MRRCRAAVLMMVVIFAPVALQAQSTYEVVQTFTPPPFSLFGKLVETPDGALYGVAAGGGPFGHGAIVRFDKLSSGTLEATIVHDFNEGIGSLGLVRGPDGALYGTSCRGGTHDSGTFHKYVPGGTFTTLHSFDPAVDSNCPAALTLATDGNFYALGQTSITSILRITPQGEVSILATLPVEQVRQSLVAAPDGHLYGFTRQLVFSVSMDGTYTVLSGSGAAGDIETLILASDGNFYGTTTIVQQEGIGSLFRMTPGGQLTLLRYGLPGNVRDLIQATDGRLYGVTWDIFDVDPEIGTIFQATTAGQLSVIHRFSYWREGLIPQSLMQSADGSLYGYTRDGGPTQRGIVFRLNSSGVAVVHWFPGRSPLNPYGTLTRGPDGALYGTSCAGGDFNAGTIYRLTPANELTVLHSFVRWDGWCPGAGLMLATDGMFYGTTRAGGLFGRGSIFRITSTGVFTPVHFFSGLSGQTFSPLLQASDGNLYGTYPSGPGGGVFRITPGGYSVVHPFGGAPADLRQPFAGPSLGSDGALYGSVLRGDHLGSPDSGAAFRMTLGGSLTFLPTTPGGAVRNPIGRLIPSGDGGFYGTAVDTTIFKMTSDGAATVFGGYPAGWGLVIGDLVVGSDGNVYGTHIGPRATFIGAIFRMTPSGAITILHTFSDYLDGSQPAGGLIEASPGVFYGTTIYGGVGLGGVIYRLTVPGSQE